MNKRISIKDKIEDRLKANININIYRSRYLPAQIELLPCICIYAPDENHEKSSNNDLYDNNCEVHIVYYTTGKDCTEDIDTGLTDIDDNLDSMCETIENLFCKRWETLDKTVYNSSLLSTHTSVGGLDDLDEIVGTADLKFNFNYKVACAE